MGVSQLTLWLGDDMYFKAYRKGLFVIVRQGRPPGGGLHTRRNSHVLARGRLINDSTIRVTRSELSQKAIREMLKKSGRDIKVVGVKRR